MSLNCNNCNKKYYEPVALVKHKLLKHNEITNISFFRCKKCDNKLYMDISGLSKHWTKKHNNIKTYFKKDNIFICIVCDRKLSGISCVSIDNKFYKEVQYKCGSCFNMFNYEKDTERIETNEETYKRYIEKEKKREKDYDEMRKLYSTNNTVDFADCRCFFGCSNCRGDVGRKGV